jgi:hypothetical protein
MTAAARTLYMTAMRTLRTHRIFLAPGTIAAGLSLLVLSNDASVASAQTRNVSKFGDWTVYAHDEASGRVCFASTPPRASDPPQDTGFKPLLYVSSWPREGVRAEVSVKTASPLKPGALGSIIVDKATFKLTSNGDRAYVLDPTDELKLLDAMKKGASVIVVAQTERGVVAKDTYSLSGITQALQAMTAACK